MVEIRRLSLPKPAVQIRSLTSPELDPHSRRTGLRPERIKVVKRLRKDHLPPTPMPTPVVKTPVPTPPTPPKRLTRLEQLRKDQEEREKAEREGKTPPPPAAPKK